MRSRSRVRKCQYGSRAVLHDPGRSAHGDHAYSKIEYNADGNSQSYSEDLDPPGRRHYRAAGSRDLNAITVVWKPSNRGAGLYI